MAVRHFDCENCSAHGKITFKEDEYKSSDVAFCPFCGADIFVPEDDDDEEE